MKHIHDLSRPNKLTFSIGEYVPLNWFPVLPGDILRGGVDFFTRVAPLNSPCMTKLEIVIETHYVPDRQTWEDAEEFHSGGAFGSTPPVHPTVDLWARTTGVGVGSLAEMLGLPVGGSAGKRTVSALPFRAYNAIANHNIIDEDTFAGGALTNSTASGNDTTSNLASIVVNWKKDYFQNMKLRQQKVASVLMEIERLASAPAWHTYKAGTDVLGTSAQTVKIGGSGQIYQDALGDSLSLDPVGGLVLNARDVRDSLILQKYFENAERRGSNKYSDYIAQAFGVSKQDMRLADPLKLSYQKDTLKFTEVIQSAPDSTLGTTDASGVGKYRGHGIGATKARGYKQFIPEHGIVMTVAYIRPAQNVYTGGIDRHWLKTLKEHYFQPELAHLSQQIVTARELNADSTTPTTQVGFVDMYEEYRQSLPYTSGKFNTTLDHFHLDQVITTNPPVLNTAFKAAIPDPRIFQDTTDDHFYSIAYNNIKAARIVPASGMPK